MAIATPLLSLVSPGGLLAAGDAPNSHVTLHVLLTYFQTDDLSLAVDAILFLIGLAYLGGVRRLAAKGRGWSRLSTGAFLAGLAMIFVAVGSGLAAYDDINLSAHVVQHLLLMMIAPPLMAFGRPITLIAQASSRPTQVRVLRIVNGKTLHFLSGPFSWALYYGSMWVYFLTPAYAYSEAHPLVHDALHGLFLAIGYLFWQGVIGLDPSRARVPHNLRLGALFLGMPVESFLGLTLLNLDKPIAPGYTVAATHDGGAVFWITSMLVMALAIIVTVNQWVKSEERRAARIDAAFDRHAELGEPQITDEQMARLRRLVAPGPPSRGESGRLASNRHDPAPSGPGRSDPSLDRRDL